MRSLRLAGFLVSATVVGVVSALLAIVFLPGKATVDLGPWRTSLAVGSEASGMYLRASVALMGLLALNHEETVYFLARTDESGERLRSWCDYRIEGERLPTRWWSLTAYGSFTFFIPNSEHRYSYNHANVGGDEQGRFAVHLASAPREPPWLPSGEEAQLHLVLRLYNPQPEVYAQLASAQKARAEGSAVSTSLPLPRIVRERCR